MSNFVPTDRKTDYLLPPSVDDWLTQDHLARFVVEVIDSLDLSKLTRQYAGRGSKAHHPATLLAILVYGYCTGIFSSRKLEKATYDSVAFRYIAAGSHPDHDTLATFRRRSIDELAWLFVQVLEMATEINGGAGLWHHQVGDGFQAVLAARFAQSHRRMESGLPGLECQTRGRTTSKG